MRDGEPGRGVKDRILEFVVQIAGFGRLRGRGGASLPGNGAAQLDTEMAAPVQQLRTPDGTGALSPTRSANGSRAIWRFEEVEGNRESSWGSEEQQTACGARKGIFINLPLSRFPLRGQAGAGGFPPRRKQAARQPTTLSRIMLPAPPTRGTAVPLWIPCRGLRPCDPAAGSTSALDTGGPLMEAATRERGPGR